MNSDLETPTPQAAAPDNSAAVSMPQVSRALRNGWHDRAFVLVREYAGSGAVAAAFLIESGVPVDELPREAKRAVAESQSEAA